MHFDVIVIGVGSMGSAACSFLSERNCRVLGLDQFDPPHEQGSHTGQTRIIRKAYYEHPDYVPLLNKAYANWSALEGSTGVQVYHKTGLLYHGPADHPIMKGVKHAASFNEIGIAVLSPPDSQRQFPQFRFRSSGETILEPEAGFLIAEKAIALYRDLAIQRGASIQTNEKVINWSHAPGIVTVVTNKSIYKARKLIITAGAWAGKMIPDLPTSLAIMRQVIAWVLPENPNSFSTPEFPCWFIADDGRKGALYGFPFLTTEKFGPPGGVKIAWHGPGEPTDPDRVQREITPKEIYRLLESVSEYIPALHESKITAAKTCLYSNSQDENFIIDHLPGYNSDVTVACGFSGHGFKFVSVIGEILADLALEGKTQLPIGFLGLDRFC